MDWNDVISKDELDYIMGNPPFLGCSMQNAGQKQDVLNICRDENGKSYKTAGKIDYVSAWYFKAAEMIQNSNIEVAFVSTNSITQGEQVASVWEPLYKRFNIIINFAHQTFIWDSEANVKAHVHCVIIGFGTRVREERAIYSDNNKCVVESINPYLIEGPIVFINSRLKPLCNVAKMTTGNRPADGGYLIIEAEDYDEFIEKEPTALKYIKQLTGAVEFINNKKRYCLWLVGADVSEVRKMPEVVKRIERCREDRLNGALDRQKLADTPRIWTEASK